MGEGHSKFQFGWDWCPKMLILGGQGLRLPFRRFGDWQGHRDFLWGGLGLRMGHSGCLKVTWRALRSGW
jgi:hypothetical protein